MKYFLILLVTLGPIIASAQHEHHTMPDTTQNQESRQHMDHNSMNHDHMAMAHDSMPTMSHSFSRNLPMNRNGSGTAWMPDETPLYAYMKHGRKWNYMLHGSIFLRYNWQNLNNNYQRGGKQLDAPNWLMGMAQRNVGNRGLLTVRAMLSFDPLTMGGNGYPLLFQSGESYNGKPLIDRQHPHDLVSELGVGYTHMLNRDMDVYGYVGFPGEPAVGPTAFMHRISAFNNPDAPLGHHWQDATHIVFGVATAGFRYKILKAEGSVFTGREPNENRYGFDKPRFDSYSYRISANPNANFSLQFSQAWIKSPELLRANEDVKRTTASVLHSKMLGPNSHWTSALVWGLNNSGDHHKEHSVLAESNWQINRFAVYGRYEFVQKSSEELGLDRDTGDPLLGEQTFNVHSFTLGTSYTLFRQWNTNFILGAQGTFYQPDSRLQFLYGNNPLSAQVYLRITPGLLKMNGMSMR